MLKPLRTPKELADELRISRKTVYRLISEGKIRAARIGRSLRITEEEFNRLTGKG
jgi:excisionase family DNA binding protein